jgi:hypothetical protein
MKTLNYYLLLMCLPMAVQSQTSFQYVHVQETLLLEAADVIEKNDGEFLFAHSQRNGWSKLGLGKLSSQGQKILLVQEKVMHCVLSSMPHCKTDNTCLSATAPTAPGLFAPAG